MEKVTVSYTYDVKHFVSDNICLTECGKYINVKKGIELNQFYRGLEICIYISGKAIKVKDLKPIKKEIYCPF